MLNQYEVGYYVGANARAERVLAYGQLDAIEAVRERYPETIMIRYVNRVDVPGPAQTSSASYHDDGLRVGLLGLFFGWLFGYYRRR